MSVRLIYFLLLSNLINLFDKEIVILTKFLLVGGEIFFDGFHILKALLIFESLQLLALYFLCISVDGNFVHIGHAQ